LQIRKLWILNLAVLVLLLGADHPRKSQESARRPNILWISDEDISLDLGCYGDA